MQLYNNDQYDLHQDIWIRCMKQIKNEHSQYEYDMNEKKCLTSENAVRISFINSLPRTSNKEIFNKRVLCQNFLKKSTTNDSDIFSPSLLRSGVKRVEHNNLTSYKKNNEIRRTESYVN